MTDMPKSLLGDFDPSALLPKLDSMMGKMGLILRIAVLIGPLCLLVLGAIYFLIPPKEANHRFGYRCYHGMGSVEAWRFTQKVAGIAWGGLGLVLTVVMLLVSGGFSGQTMDVAVWTAAKCLLWELGLLAVTCITIDILVAATFDKKGDRRKKK